MAGICDDYRGRFQPFGIKNQILVKNPRPKKSNARSKAHGFRR